MKVTCLLLAVAMALPVEAVAGQPDRFRLIGSPIYSADGAEVGTIADTVWTRPADCVQCELMRALASDLERSKWRFLVGP
jgi:hypothetical protein